MWSLNAQASSPTRRAWQNISQAGAKNLILSAPSKGESDVPMVVHCVDTPEGSCQIISCASCTTNCAAPVMEVLQRRIGVKKATMTTIHAYTSSQAIVDGPAKKFRRGRAGAANFVPTSTGAAKAVTKILPELKGKFDGIAVRGPVPVGSLVDIVLVAARPTTVEEINRIFEDEAKGPRYKGVLAMPMMKSSLPISSAKLTPPSSTPAAPRSWTAIW